MGFGHRVQELRSARQGHQAPGRRCSTPPATRCSTSPSSSSASRSDEYFIKRKLYPNVDFYSGLIYQAMGFPDRLLHGPLRHPAHLGLAGPVVRDARRQRAEDRASPPGSTPAKRQARHARQPPPPVRARARALERSAPRLLLPPASASPLTRPTTAPELGGRGILRGLQTFQLARPRIDAGEGARGHSHLCRVLVRHREVAWKASSMKKAVNPAGGRATRPRQTPPPSSVSGVLVQARPIVSGGSRARAVGGLPQQNFFRCGLGLPRMVSSPSNDQVKLGRGRPRRSHR